MVEINLDNHEIRKIRGALHDQYDRHHGKGNDEVAKEYRELINKLNEADK